jgi:hypothetical protein
MSAPSAAGSFPSVPPLQAAPQKVFPPNSWWPWIALGLGLGWLITLIAWWRARGHLAMPSAPVIKKQKPQKIRIVTRSQQEELLKNGCLSDDAPNARVHLLAWARQRWPEQSPDTLTALARQCEPALAEAVIELDRHLYADKKDTWRGDRLWDLFQRQQATAGPAPSTSDSVLEPLYKS